MKSELCNTACHLRGAHCHETLMNIHVIARNVVIISFKMQTNFSVHDCK